MPPSMTAPGSDDDSDDNHTLSTTIVIEMNQSNEENGAESTAASAVTLSDCCCVSPRFLSVMILSLSGGSEKCDFTKICVLFFFRKIDVLGEK
jgi:hypothetical protein